MRKGFEGQGPSWKPLALALFQVLLAALPLVLVPEQEARLLLGTALAFIQGIPVTSHNEATLP